MELELAQFDLPHAIDNALVLRARARARTHGITLEVEIDDSSRATVKADERKVKQVLLNLLSNAVKFTAGGWTDRRQRRQASTVPRRFR